MASARVESLKFLIPIAVLILLVLLLPGLASGILSAILLLLFGGTFYFFRDPERQPPADASVIVSSADGLVTHIETVENAPFNLGKMRRVSVFLSVFDVHVNRVPYGGTIAESVHTPGQFLDARANDCATQNERMDWHLQTDRGPLVVRQIAGLIARRIVGWARPQDMVLTGQRLGMIRFGSRTDIFLPLNTEVLVQIGDKVQGSLTPLARWTEAPFASFLTQP